MNEHFSFDLSLGHTAKDKAVVRPLAERLRADGLKVWLYEWVVKPGASIPAKIEAGLEHSRVLVLCMSAQAFGSDWAQLEGGRFRFRDLLNQERPFVPLRLDDAPNKGSLAHGPIRKDAIRLVIKTAGERSRDSSATWALVYA